MTPKDIEIAKALAKAFLKINSIQEFAAFLSGMPDINTADDDEKYATLSMVTYKFLQLANTDANMVANIAIGMLTSAALGDAKGNVPAAQQALITEVLPMLIQCIENLDKIVTFNVELGKENTGTLNPVDKANMH